MNPIAEQALLNAGNAIRPIPFTAAISVKRGVTSAPPNQAGRLEQAAKPAGPINRLMVNQGQRFALEMVDSYGDQLSTARGVLSVIARLNATLSNKPESFALGICNIVEILHDGLSMVPHTESDAEQEAV